MPGARLKRREREEISRQLAAGRSFRAIARTLGRAASTISREVKKNTPKRPKMYRAFSADLRAQQRAKRPRKPKLSEPQLRAYVCKKLKVWWSPEQIANRLRHDFPGNQTMRVSHETIYKSLFSDDERSLDKTLLTNLRTRRKRRRQPANRRKGKAGKLHGVRIHERPRIVETRTEPGHWEGDLVVGKRGQSQFITLVERTTRYTLLAALPSGRTAMKVYLALLRLMRATRNTVPSFMWRSLTWDRGKEIAEHARFTAKTGIPVYLCDPHSPWQRGTNENTNRLIRQYFPRGMDLSKVCQHSLYGAEFQLNARPREILGWRTPEECLREITVATAG